MDMNTDTPVSKTQGEAFIKEYIRLHNELLKMKELMDSPDSNLKNYETHGFISFIFKKQRIDELFQDQTDANALRIYYGAHHDGEPTLVIVPCMVSSDGKQAQNKIRKGETVTEADPSGDAEASGGGEAWSIKQHPEPKTGRGYYGIVEFDLENDPIG